ncbi:putative quinol monooxygenase [Lacrimispora sp. JR3]|uniref:putative quinol monooxygenase n=1 Tax=Lacrimispora sinapis TaxID=3111456 RepID=UPI003749CB1F
MIKIIANNYIKADKVEEFIRLAKGLVENTRAKDAGCIRYELLQDIKNPQILTMVEEWEDQESLNGHANSSHFKEVMAATADFSEKPAELHICRTIL